MIKFKLAPVASLTLLMLAAPSVSAAVYKVVELPLSEKARNSYPTAINNSGEYVASVDNIYKPSINVDLLDFEDTTFTDLLTDVDAAKAGNFNDEDYALLYSFLSSNTGNMLIQQLATYLSFKGDENQVDAISGFNPDVYKNANNLAYGINDNGWVVGTAADGYDTLSYVNAENETVNYQVKEFIGRRAYVDINGQTIPLIAPENIVGGVSIARDINNNNLVVGQSSTEITETSQEAIDTAIEVCEDDEARGDFPIELCLQAIPLPTYNMRATMWQLNNEGEITDVKVLGVFTEPEDDVTSYFTSDLNAINNNGIAVGQSVNYYQNTTTSANTFAAIFINDEIKGITDHQEFRSSVATDINDTNLVVGQAAKIINGYSRTKFFIHNIDTNETTYPSDYFVGSSSVAHAINNNNKVVGEGEVDTAANTTRRRHGFIYDHNDKTFSDLNDLLSCNSEYSIVQANDINDNDEIIATAIVKRALKNVVGNPVLDNDGSEIIQDVITAVKLVPIPGGGVDTCAEEEKFQRQAGSINFMIILFCGLLVLRRRLFN
ncbi:DUF3466 family protein [Alteromonadaceae bacterium BrNp21-10]|nr:DUF3466 family protein [Alteromonadaceae bacterium BrNp21-10]